MPCLKYSTISLSLVMPLPSVLFEEEALYKEAEDQPHHHHSKKVFQVVVAPEHEEAISVPELFPHVMLKEVMFSPALPLSNLEPCSVLSAIRVNRSYHTGIPRFVDNIF